jgi:hypothetical protein
VHAPVEWAVADLPVTAVGAARAQVLSPAKVTLHLRGSSGAVTSNPKDFEATVSVSGLGAGEFLVPVRVVAPEGVGVIRVEPSDLRVRIR